MNARDALIEYAASTRTVTADGLAPYTDRIEREAEATADAWQKTQLRRLEFLDTSLVNYINDTSTPGIVAHILTGLMALASTQAQDEHPLP